jgi:hypothetical protein
MQRRGLRFEQLEQRVLLAGDVTVALKSGNLTVTGDANVLGNQVEIAHQGDGIYRVTGLNGTTLNKGTATVWNSTLPVTGSVSVDLKNGSNHLTMKGDPGQDLRVLKNLSVKTGTGNDTVIIENPNVTGKLTVSTGAGGGSVIIDGGTVTADASIQTGVGDDQVEIDDTTFLGKLTVKTGNAGTLLKEDSVILSNITVSRDVSVSTGTGNDRVWIEDLTVLGKGKLTVTTGNGYDRVGVIDSDVGGNISISTGNENDQAGLLRVTTNGNLTVSGGNGNYTKPDENGNRGDRIGIAGVTATSVTLDGGSGGANRTPGLSEIGVTGSTIRGNLTIKSGNGIDQVGIGIHPEITEQLQEQLVHPRGEVISLGGAVGAVSVGTFGNAKTGTVSINTGNYSQDYVAIGDLTARVLKLTMGPGDDTVVVRDNIQVTQEVTIKTNAGNDTLAIVGNPGAFVANLPAKKLIDGGTGNGDTLKSDPVFTLPLDAVFKNWELRGLLT